MKITKYPQSCIVIEKNGRRIVIDPGMFVAQSYSADDMGDVAAVIYTHEHADHYDEAIAKAFRANGAEFYANASTAKLVGDCTIVNDGDEFEVAGFKVAAKELPHCLLPNNQAGPQNTGYVIDGVLFHPGDGKELAGLTVENVALPITGPDISMLDAMNFADQLKAKVVVPVHYDAILADPKTFAAYAEKGGRQFEVRVLADGESTEV